MFSSFRFCAYLFRVCFPFFTYIIAQVQSNSLDCNRLGTEIQPYKQDYIFPRNIVYIILSFYYPFYYQKTLVFLNYSSSILIYMLLLLSNPYFYAIFSYRFVSQFRPFLFSFDFRYAESTKLLFLSFGYIWRTLYILQK